MTAKNEISDKLTGLTIVVILLSSVILFLVMSYCKTLKENSYT